MKTQHSFTFEVRRYVSESQWQINSLESNTTSAWIMSAGRWDTMEQATQAAALWLVRQAAEDAQQYEIRVVQVEELELTDAN